MIDIERLIDDLKMTQVEFAKFINVRQPTVSGYKKAKRLPERIREIILKAQGIDVDDYIIKGKEITIEDYSELNYIDHENYNEYILGILNTTEIELPRILVNGNYDPDKYVCIDISGDKMNNGSGVHDKDIVLGLKKDKLYWSNLLIKQFLYVAIMKNGIIPFQIIASDINIFSIHYWNNKYPDEIINTDDILELLLRQYHCIISECAK